MKAFEELKHWYSTFLKTTSTSGSFSCGQVYHPSKNTARTSWTTPDRPTRPRGPLDPLEPSWPTPWPPGTLLQSLGLFHFFLPKTWLRLRDFLYFLLSLIPLSTWFYKHFDFPQYYLSWWSNLSQRQASPGKMARLSISSHSYHRPNVATMVMKISLERSFVD